MATRERIPVVIVEDYDEIARQIAARIAEMIRERNAEGRAAVLGLATGSTPIGIYRELIRMHREEGLDFSNVVTFNLDEYYPMAPDSIHSYHRYMWENLFDHINMRNGERAHAARRRGARRGGGRTRASTRRRSRRRAGSTSRSWGSGRRGTSASTSRAPAWNRARGWWRSTPSRGATRPRTSSVRTTFPPRRSRWASPASWTRARSR